ncbi:MAG: ankyrin [Paenibacillus sp.]|jgi:ankyrin repeat protein|nr:ankyrin [Paenibacillus sp.]
MQQSIFDAVKRKDLETVTMLCAGRPELVNKRDMQGNSPIMLSAYYGAKDIVGFLLESGAMLNLYEACAIGKLETVRALLLQRPELLNSFAHDGFTPIGLAAFFGHEDVAAFLVKQGADVRVHSYNAMRVTPLHSAVATRKLAIAELLVHNGADVSARQQSDWTPLHGAVHNKQVEMVRLLLKHGADPAAVNEAGVSAAAMADESGDSEIVSVIQEYLSRNS